MSATVAMSKIVKSRIKEKFTSTSIPNMREAMVPVILKQATILQEEKMTQKRCGEKRHLMLVMSGRMC
eukprot:8645851-Ditylum_brightwellii.AAC.1